MKNLILITYMCLIMACNSNIQNITCEKLYPSDSLNIELGIPTTIKIQDSLLYVMDLFGEDGFIKVINVNKDSLLFSFARKGNGPNEYLVIQNIDIYKQSDRTIIGLFDPALKKYRSYDQDSLLLKKGSVLPFDTKTRKDDLTVSNLYKLNNGYIGAGLLEKGKFVIFNNVMDEENYTCDYRPKPANRIPDVLHAEANFGTIFISHDHKLLGSTVYHAGVLLIYDINDNRITPKWEYIIDDVNYEVNGGKVIHKKDMIGYLSGDFSYTNVYALYAGVEEDKNEIATYAHELHVFNMRGDVIKKYDLQRELFAISKDITRNKLYAIAHRPEPKIYVYNIE